MIVDSQEIRSERHARVGTLIQRDATLILERWSQRAIAEQPTAQRVHHEILLDRLAVFVRALGRSLAEVDDLDTSRHRSPALEHGEQRWQTGWSLPELIRDYQLLRLVLLEYLDEMLERPLTCREVMAVNLAIDESITASVGMYVSNREEYVAQTERERAEREKERAELVLKSQTALLQEENRRKDEFLATLGHELRNPLSPIRNAVHVLQMREPDAATLTWVKDVVERQVQHMTRLVEELLDISRISRKKMELHREPIDLGWLLRTVAQDHQSALEHAGLTLTQHLPGEPVLVLADAVRLTQVVGNLLHNATKFTDPGGSVTLRLAVDQEKGRALVTVRDTGIGMEAEAIARVFEAFSQAESGKSRSRSGLGIGLAVVKGIVALHGGEVCAESEGPGQGSMFTFWLPLVEAVAPSGKLPTRKEAMLILLRILIIDDNPDAAQSEQILLSLQGHEVAVAYSGPAGVQLARQFRPDVVLCDLGLPGMDGYEVAQALRQEPTTKNARLIAVTGYGSEGDKQRCQEVGFERVLTKPVDPDELERVLTTRQS